MNRSIVLLVLFLFSVAAQAGDVHRRFFGQREYIYSLAADRPAALAIADAGACHIATDTGDTSEWSGASWIEGFTCGRSSSNTELPAAVDLEAAIDSPVGPYVGSLLYSYDGTDWDPIQQDVQDLDSGAGSDNVAGGFVATPASGGEQVVPSGQTSVAVTISTATTTQIVALAASQKIYITGGVLVSSGANTVTLKYGTGAACGTGTTSISGAMDFTAQTGIGFNSGFGPSLVIPSAQAFCITTSAAVQLSGWITYAQY